MNFIWKFSIDFDHVTNIVSEVHWQLFATEIDAKRRIYGSFIPKVSNNTNILSIADIVKMSQEDRTAMFLSWAENVEKDFEAQKREIVTKLFEPQLFSKMSF